MTSYPILYSFRRCPYAMRCRMALMQAGVVCELREVALTNKPKEMLSLSPKGTVPVLKLGDDIVLEESLDIMRWALETRDPDNWLEGLDEAASLLSYLDKQFKGALDRYKYHVNYPECSQPYYRRQGEVFLDMLEERLVVNKGQGLCDMRTTFADIAVFPFIRQFAFVDKVWFDGTHYHLLQSWLKCHLESELFQSVMQKYALWNSINEAQLFGRL